MATRKSDPHEEWNDRTQVDDLDENTEELAEGGDVTLAEEEPSAEARPAPTSAPPATPAPGGELRVDTNVHANASAVLGGQGADAMFQKSRQLFRDAMQDIRAGRLAPARMNLKLASTYAPDQLAPRALNTFLGEADDGPAVERAWARADLVQRFAFAAARGVAVAELRGPLELHASRHKQDAGRPITVEQLLDVLSRLQSAGAKPRGLDDPVPFSRVAPKNL